MMSTGDMAGGFGNGMGGNFAGFREFTLLFEDELFYGMPGEEFTIIGGMDDLDALGGMDYDGPGLSEGKFDSR